MISFSLPIAAVAKGRPRFGNGRTFTPAKTVKFEREIRMAATAFAPAEPLKGPLSVLIRIWMPKPKSSKNLLPSVRPDLDNFVKGIADALNGLFWIDDAQICSLLAFKFYEPFGRSKIDVEIVALNASQTRTDSPQSISEAQTTHSEAMYREALRRQS